MLTVNITAAGATAAAALLERRGDRRLHLSVLASGLGIAAPAPRYLAL